MCGLTSQTNEIKPVGKSINNNQPDQSVGAAQKPGAGAEHLEQREQVPLSWRLRVGDSRRDLGVTEKVICIWSPTCTKACMMERLDKVAERQSGLRDTMRLINYKLQSNNWVRGEVAVSQHDNQRILEVLRDEGKLWGWYVRPHIEYGKRPANLGVIVNSENNSTASGYQTTQDGKMDMWLKVGTLNVNGAARNREMIRYVLTETGIHILALQETLVKATDWMFKIPNFQTFNVFGQHTVGERGVTLVISNKFNSQVIDNQDPYRVIVRVSGGDLRAPMLVASVYVNTGVGHKTRAKALANGLSNAMSKYPEDDIMVMGDFNQTHVEVSDFLQENVDGNFQVLRLINGTQTRRVGHSGRVIDHIAVLRRHGGKQTSARVNRRFDVSDHWLVGAKMQVSSEPKERPTAERRKYEVLGLIQPQGGEVEAAKEKVKQFTGHNRFQVLSTYIKQPNISLSDAATKFTDTIAEVAEDLELRPKQRTAALHLTRQTKRLLKERVTKFGELQRATENVQEAKAAYLEARRNARKGIAEERQLKLHREIKAAAAARSMQPRSFWQWAARNAGWRGSKGASAGSHPVRDPHSGQVVDSSEEIGLAWKNHYGLLAADETGHSQDEKYWRRKFRKWKKAPRLEELNAKITVSEVRRAIRALKNYKAPGQDLIPAEVYKLAIVGEDEEHPMMDCLYELINRMFEEGDIPEMWASSEVVSIPKKGDLTDMGNWRGISLMGVGLKILLKVMARRLSECFETHNLFTKAQAGFREKEECPLQYANLLEVCQRRAHKGKKTYVCFVDLKKAYDTVPHGALLTKLAKYGVRGKMLEMIRGLYAKSTIAVRMGNKPPYELTDPVPLLKGVRQGCPLSPVLFNIFINDIDKDGRLWGASTSRDLVVPSAMFADDLALIAGTRRRIRKATWLLTKWLRDNEMRVGIHKCGVMLVGGDNGRLRQPGEEVRISNMVVPVVDSYTYLGLEFRQDLDTSAATIAPRVVRARVLERTLSRYLSSSRIPPSLKIPVIQAVVVPSVLYGGEVFGMKRAAVFGPAQSVVDRCYKRALGINPNRRISQVMLWKECDVQPLQALAAGRRVRALLKAPTTKTWLGDLVEEPFRSLGHTWVTGARRFLNRQYRRGMAAIEADELSGGRGIKGREDWIKARYSEVGTNLWESSPETQVIENTMKGMCLWIEAKHATVSSSRYTEAEYAKRCITGRQVAVEPRLTGGLAAVSRLRLGAMTFGPQLVRAKELGGEYRTKCPCCGEDAPETLEHFLFDCAAWASDRERFLRRHIEASRRILGGADAWEVATLLLGGSIRGRQLENWYSAGSIQAQSDLGLCAVETAVSYAENPSAEVPGGSGGLWDLARFLQCTVGARMRKLSGLRMTHDSESAVSQSPNG